MEDLVLITERRLSSAITKLWANIKASMAAKVHTHAISDVTNLQSNLDSKAPIDSPSFTTGIYSPVVSTNKIFGTGGDLEMVSDLMDNESSIILRADGDIKIKGNGVESGSSAVAFSVPSSTSSKKLITAGAVAAGLNEKANSNHNHSINDITNLQTELTKLKKLAGGAY